METVRYFVALFAVIAYPPAFLFWILVHPLTPMWRRIGLVLSYLIILTILAGLATGLYLFRDVILAVDFKTNWFFICFAIILMSAGIAIEIRCRRQLSFLTLVGVPELKPEGRSGRLLKAGIYAQMRHPRYTGASLGLIAVAFFTNYPATYLLTGIGLPTIYLITILEERELVERFGDDYRKYQGQVPRFIPRRFVKIKDSLERGT